MLCFDRGESFSHRKRTGLFVVQQDVSLCSEVSSHLSSDVHRPFLLAVDPCDVCVSSSEGSFIVSFMVEAETFS